MTELRRIRKGGWRTYSNLSKWKITLTSALVTLLVKTPVVDKKKGEMTNMKMIMWCLFVAYQTNSLQTEQKVGWGKNVALNSWHLTTWILACLIAPRRWWRANRPSLSRSDSGSPSVWPAASETRHTQPLFKTENGCKRSWAQLRRGRWLLTAKKISHLSFNISYQHHSFILTKESVLSVADPLCNLGLSFFQFNIKA